MTAINSVSSNTSVASVLASARGDVMAQAMAVLLTRYDSLRGDLEAQIHDVETRNAAKRAWNGQLMKLNQMMEAVAATGKPSNEKVDVYLAPGDLQYKDYKVVTGPGGEVRLEPTTTDPSNYLAAECEPIYGPPGSDPKTVASDKKALEEQRAHLMGEMGLIPSRGMEFGRALERRLGEVQAKLDQYGPNQTIVGYRVKVSADMVKAQTDNVRTAIDNLNTESEIGMLRLNDTFGKSNLAVEQLGKLLEGQNKTLGQLLANF